MVSYLSLAAMSFGMGFTGALMPGPLMFATVNRAGKGGILTGIAVTGGHGLAELVLAGALILAGSYLGKDWVRPGPILIGAVAVVGGMALGGFGVLAGLSAVRRPGVLQGGGTKPVFVGIASDFVAGAAVSAMNPYWTLWWMLTGLPLLVTGYATGGTVGLGVVFAAHVMSDLVVYGGLAYLTRRGISVMGTKGYLYVEVISALAMAALGALFIVLGAHILCTGQVPQIGEAGKP